MKTNCGQQACMFYFNSYGEHFLAIEPRVVVVVVVVDELAMDVLICSSNVPLRCSTTI